MGGPLSSIKKWLRKHDPAVPCTSFGTLVVTVKRQDTHAAVAGAKITLRSGPTEGHLSTDADGKAKWKACADGDYVVDVGFEGENKRRYEVPEPGKALPKVVENQTTECEIEVLPIDRKLRIILIDAKNQPIAGRAWKLTAPVSASGTTGADGLIEVDLEASLGKGALQVKLRDPRPAVAAAPAAQPPPPAYPPSIVPADFADRDAGPVVPPVTDDTVDWRLTLVDPRKPEWKKDGFLRQRLHNLGFAIDNGGSPLATTAAVRAYQAHYQTKKDGTGDLAEIEADLKTRHDRP